MDWYEKSILGCSLERWLSITSADDFNSWLEEKEAHRDSAVGLLTRFCRSIGQHKKGRGVTNLLSYGCYYNPEKWQPPFIERHSIFPGGFYNSDTEQIEPFYQEEISEDLRYSWFVDNGDERHPFNSETIPDYKPDADCYSFAKATRYKDRVVQLGPLSDMVIAGDPLISSFYKAEGSNTWLRQFTRLHRPVILLYEMRKTIMELLKQIGEPTYFKTIPKEDGDGYGLINAARGSLGHWVKIRRGKIESYQVITPTTWNGSPRDRTGRRGHWEESFIGLEIDDLNNPVELSHLVRSHDACLVCTVHFLKTDKEISFKL
jgi:uptake hydrogenase large subunit